MKERSNLSRWTMARKGLLPVLVALTGALPFASFGYNTYTFNVPEGETDTLTNMVERLGYSALTHGDTIKKTGTGTLNYDYPYHAPDGDLLRANLTIDAGVYYISEAGSTSAQSFNGRTVTVKPGATFNLMARKTMFDGRNLPIHFAGDGTGEGDNLGAIAVGGSLGDATFDARPNFIMDGDATIYTYGTMNAIFSGSSDSPSKLNMNGHTLTLKGKDASSVFRPRWDWIVTNAGPIIVSSGQFTRHNDTKGVPVPITVAPHNIPRITFKDGARMAAYTDGENSPWSYVDVFEFEAGTKLFKGNGSPTTATMTMKKVIGPADISAADVTISEELVVRGSDIAAGNALSSVCTLTFSEGCKLSVDGFGGISLARGATHTVASTTATINGTPELTGVATNFFTLSNSGTALVLTVKDAVVDIVNDWGVQTGEANAAANAAAVAEQVGSVGNGVVLYVPAGEYWFSDTLDLSSVTASGVRIWNPERNAVLHSGIAVGAATDLTVEGIVFNGCAGPAVVANGTAGLTVTNCGIVNVVGTYAGGHYPFAALGVADFNVCDCDWTVDTALWDAQGYFEGGTQAAASEVYDGAVVVKVPEGESGVSWDTATNRMGLAAGAYSGKKLRKVGRGEFYPGNGGAAISGINGVEIVEGAYLAGTNTALGVDGGYVRVHDGANLTFVSAASARGSSSIKQRTIYLSGTGLSATLPAVRFDANWLDVGITWVLENDATMYVNSSESSTSYNTFLNECFVRANGHTLTLTGGVGYNFRFRYNVGWYGGGTVIVDGLALTSSTAINGNGFRVVSGDAPLFVFKNGAKFRPGIGSLCGLIKNCEFESGTQISPLSAGLSLAFDNFAGAPEALANPPAITINGLFTVRAADVAAGRYATSAGALAFGENATWKIDNPEALARGDYPVFTAACGITGKPKADPSMGDVDWRAYLSDANTLSIGPKVGLRIILR